MDNSTANAADVARFYTSGQPAPVRPALVDGGHAQLRLPASIDVNGEELRDQLWRRAQDLVENERGTVRRPTRNPQMQGVARHGHGAGTVDLDPTDEKLYRIA